MSNRACELYGKVLDRTDEDPLTIGYVDGQLVLDNGKVIITTRAIEGEWPYEGFKTKFLDKSEHGSVLMVGETLTAALGRAALVSGEERTPVADLSIADGTVNVKTDETATYGGSDESFSCKGDYASQVKVLVKFVQESVDKATSGEVRVHVAGPKKPVYISGEHVDESKVPFTTLSGIMPIVQRVDVVKEAGDGTKD
jgi:DNA polymerase III sliding clamp (beta) subunit (PCNA family)